MGSVGPRIFSVYESNLPKCFDSKNGQRRRKYEEIIPMTKKRYRMHLIALIRVFEANIVPVLYTFESKPKRCKIHVTNNSIDLKVSDFVYPKCRDNFDDFSSKI
jgi:hypothetical protein